MIEVKRESKKVPPEYEEFLARAGGTNFFGEPNFKLVWGESHVSYTGSALMLLTPIPCWILMQWHSAEEFGPPSLWDHEVLGEYPHRGMYQPLQPFYEQIGKERNPMPLNFNTFEFMIPIILKHRFDSGEKRLALLREAKDRRDKELENRIADNLQDAVGNLATDAISYAGQRNKHSYVQQMMHRIEAQMGQSIGMRKGLQQVSI